MDHVISADESKMMEIQKGTILDQGTDRTLLKSQH
jgi:hypothetical protein